MKECIVIAGMTGLLRGIPAFAMGRQETILKAVNWIASGFAFAMTALIFLFSALQHPKNYR
jgi:hypothetical protein